jgi:hypothetical protein
METFAPTFSRRRDALAVAAEERKLLEQRIAEDGVLHLLHGLRGLPRIGHSSRYQPTLLWSVTNPLAPSLDYKSASFPFSSSLASRHFGGLPETQTLRLPGIVVPPSDQYYQDLAGHFFHADGYTALPLPHLVGTGESRRMLAPQSILQHAINGSTTMLSSNTASMNATAVALGLLGGRNLGEKLNNDLKHYRQEKFPVILHQALLELERVGDTSTAYFLPDGKSFAIRNLYLFEERVLRIFFPKMKGFASFQRQLNLYDFKRIRGAGADRGSYCHELFHRDRPSKACEMKRTKIKGGKPRRRRSSSTNSTTLNSDNTGGEE